MAKAKEHKKQHYIPRCYLAGWLDAGVPPNTDPFVWRFARDSRDGVRKSPKNIFTETDFYTVDAVDGTRDLVLEKGLSGLEAGFVQVRKKLADHQPLSRREFRQLMAFAAAMSGRTKAFRDFQRTQWGRVETMMASMQKQWDDSTESQREALAAFGGAGHRNEPGASYEDVKAVVKNPMEFLLGINIRVTLPIFLKMDMAVLETSDEIGFITSDDPLVISDPTAYRRPPMLRGGALLLPTTEVTLPISPSQLILLNWQSLAGVFSVGVSEVDELNRRTRLRCEDYFVARKNLTKDVWFERREVPDDSWESVRRREKANETTRRDIKAT